MQFLVTILEKIAFIILLMGVGVFVKRIRLVSDEGERSVSRLMVDLTWPGLVFYSITSSLTRADITQNWLLPVLIIGVHLLGFAIGLAVCVFTRYEGERRSVFLFHSTMNNFLIMALPFVQSILGPRGVALLTIGTLGSTVVLWTVGVTLMAGRVDFWTSVKLIFSPVMVATIVAVLLVLTGVNARIPKIVMDLSETIGQPTLLLGLLIAGTQISKLGLRAFNPNGWNILVGLVRNFLVPAVVFALCILFRAWLPKETLIVIMLVSIAPASVNSITLALRYDSAPHLAAEGVLFTHLLAVPSMVCFMFLINRVFLY